MRSTSRGLKALAALLSPLVAAGPVMADPGPPEPAPALLLKFAGPGHPDPAARDSLAPLPDLLGRHLAVRWVLPPGPPLPGDGATALPEADAATLAAIAAALADAAARMDRLETEEAGRLLAEAEAAARRYRPGPDIRRLLAEIFLRSGQILLWEGKGSAAEETLARSRALRPGFSPDPALFPPAFRGAWARAASRPTPEAEILVRSVPSGATVIAAGGDRGTTPARIRIPPLETLRVTIGLPGYRPDVRDLILLPGDAALIDAALVPDPVARIGILLPDLPRTGGEIGSALAAASAAAGASLSAAAVLAGSGERPVLRVVGTGAAGGETALLAEVPWPEGGAEREEAARAIADRLGDAGWPVRGSGTPAGPPWYHKWWFWTIVGAAAVGAAALAAGGTGGSGGGGTGAIGVNF